MASCCYSVLYIISVEVFPTVIRNSALGICAVFENVAGMVSPYAADLVRGTVVIVCVVPFVILSA